MMLWKVAYSARRGVVLALVAAGFFVASMAGAQERPVGVAASKAELIALTPLWKGERYPDGRPKFPDALLERMKAVSIEDAWELLRKYNYNNQFEGNWKILRPDKPLVGRALTAAYLPSRPDLDEHILSIGKADGRIGRPNSWPIDMLQKGDVYVADGFGKVIDGTLMGDNLGTAIYARSGTGVVFYAGARDLAGLLQIDGFNAFVRGWDPSEIKGMLLTSINRPIRIGRAVVMPGDVILAKRSGVLAIPVHLAEEVVITGEIIAIKDEFGHMRLRERAYTPGQIDSRWTDAIKADFFKWYKSRKNNPAIPLSEIEKHL